MTTLPPSVAATPGKIAALKQMLASALTCEQLAREADFKISTFESEIVACVMARKEATERAESLRSAAAELASAWDLVDQLQDLDDRAHLKDGEYYEYEFGSIGNGLIGVRPTDAPDDGVVHNDLGIADYEGLPSVFAR